MILLSQISSYQYPIDKYEMRTAQGKLLRKLPSTHSMVQHSIARQKQNAPSGDTLATERCRNVNKPNLRHLKTPEHCAGRLVEMHRRASYARVRALLQGRPRDDPALEASTREGSRWLLNALPRSSQLQHSWFRGSW
jgi:hypothetical protein